jgi:hypothetical protein
MNKNLILAADLVRELEAVGAQLEARGFQDRLDDILNETSQAPTGAPRKRRSALARAVENGEKLPLLLRHRQVALRRPVNIGHRGHPGTAKLTHNGRQGIARRRALRRRLRTQRRHRDRMERRNQ